MKKKLKRGERPEGWKKGCEKFPEYYKEKNPDWTDEQCKEAAKKFCRSTNWQCIEFYERKYPELSHEEHLKMMQEKKNSKKYNSELCIEYYEKHYPELSHEEQLELLHKFTAERNYQCIEYYEKHYPHLSHKDHLRLLAKAKNNGIEKRPDNTGDKNPNSKANTSELERKQRSPKCIEFYERKYPELSHKEHEKMLKEHLEYTNSKLTPDKYNTKQEYWEAKGYNKEEAKEKVKEFQKEISFTLEHCIERYGEEKGSQVFKERQNKWQKKLRNNFAKYGDGRSNQSEFGWYMIDKICKSMNISKPMSEKYIKDIDYGRGYAFDFQYQNKLIEFNGDYWHCNPIKYKFDYFHQVKNMTAKEIWEYDARKKELAESYGYKVLTIWEHEYDESLKNNTFGNLIDKCVEFLKS